MSLGSKAGIMQSMSRGNHMISSAIWDKSARVNLEHAEIYAYVLLGLKLLVRFEIRPNCLLKSQNSVIQIQFFSSAKYLIYPVFSWFVKS